MKLFDRITERDRLTDFSEDLAVLGRRLRALGLAVPILLLAGFGAGNLANQVLEVPADRPVRIAESALVPRVHLEALSHHMHRLRSAGAETFDYVTLYQDHVAPVEAVLRRRGLSEATARNVAWPLVTHSYERGLDPAFVLSVVLIESSGKPNATSPVGARGLMQIMPLWVGYWRACGINLYDIEANLCAGTNILAYYLGRSPGDERKALLGYNGCVRGTNTPNCFTYPDKIVQLRQQLAREILLEKNKRRPGGAAAP